MNWDDKAAALRAMHVKGNPLVLYNIWDPGSAKAVADAGARALATGSWPLAAAQGFADGQAIPMEMVLDLAGRIVAGTDLPVTVDLEGGYAVAPDAVAANVARLIETGAVGLNFEDQVVGGEGLHPIAEQVARMAAIRAGSGIVINARTDLFLKEKDATQHAGLMSEALERAAAFAEAGADCFFVPGVTDVDLIARICEATTLPVNVMHPGAPEAIPALAAAGVGRISHGPIPYRRAMAWLTDQARLAFEA